MCSCAMQHEYETRAKTPVGTWAYMPPEILAGRTSYDAKVTLFPVLYLSRLPELCKLWHSKHVKVSLHAGLMSTIFHAL